MTKEEIIKKLIRNGCSLDDILPPTDGEDCLIFKVSPEEFLHANENDVVYIPDYNLNKIVHDDSDIEDSDVLMNIADHCYTKNDFLFLAANNHKMAEDLFEVTNWQNPDIEDVLDCFDNDEELKERYGMSMNEFLGMGHDRYGENEVNCICPYDDTGRKMEIIYHDGSSGLVDTSPEMEQDEDYFENHWTEVREELEIIPYSEKIEALIEKELSYKFMGMGM